MRRSLVFPFYLNLVGLVALGLSGCYRPHIQDSALHCGPDNLCPAGFVCNALGLCAQRGAPSADMSGGSGIWSGALGAKDLTGLSGVLECSTKTGGIVLNSGASSTPIVTAPLAGFQRIDQINGPTIAVWSFQTLFIPSGMTVRPSSDSDALPAFATIGDLSIEGDIDWRGFGGFGGRSNEAGAAKSVPVAAGGQPGTAEGGGGGGGHATPGVMGAGSGGGVGGMAYGSPDVAPLYAGSGGGGGGGVGGRGGPGGGAIALLSQAGITIAGQINVSGTDGFSGGAGGGGGGGGGGSGGGLVLSAAHITLSNNHELLARGGSGAAGSGTGSPGGAGANGRIWIGGDYTAGDLKATPAPTFSPNPLGAFPSQ